MLTARVEYAPGFSPLNLPDVFDWVALDNDVISYDVSRGRQDQTGAFDPGTCTIVLDGSAGDLDPLVASSSFGSGKADPGTPVRVIVSEDGTDSTRFTGFMWPEGPAPTSDRKSRAMDVTIQATDLIGWGASRPMPDCVWSTWATLGVPEIWIRGLANFDSSANPLLSGFTVLNSGWGTQYGNAAGAANINQFDSIIDGTSDPALGVSSASSLPMSGPVTASNGWQVAFAFQRVGTSGLGRNLAQCVAGANLQWRISMDTSGLIHANAYDSAGTFLNGAVAVANHDDAQPHWVEATFDKTAHTVEITTDLATSVTQTTGLSTMVASTGTITLMPPNAGSTPACLIQGFVYADTTTAGYASGPPPAEGAFSPALTSGLLANGNTYDVPGFSYAIVTSLSPSLPIVLAGVGGFGWVSAGWAIGGWRVPSGFGDALTRIGTSMGGACYMERDGRLALRDSQALTDPGPAFTARFQTELVNLTDEESPASTPPPVRYQTPSRGGARTDKIVNRVTATAYVASTGNAAKFATITSIDQASLATYGPAEYSIDSDCVNVDLLVDVAADLLTRHSSPIVELGDLTFDLWTDADARAWVLGDFELETALHYREATADGGAVPIDATYRVQHYDESFQSGTAFALTLTIAPA